MKRTHLHDPCICLDPKVCGNWKRHWPCTNGFLRLRVAREVRSMPGLPGFGQKQYHSHYIVLFVLFDWNLPTTNNKKGEKRTKKMKKRRPKHKRELEATQYEPISYDSWNKEDKQNKNHKPKFDGRTRYCLLFQEVDRPKATSRRSMAVEHLLCCRKRVRFQGRSLCGVSCLLQQEKW